MLNSPRALRDHPEKLAILEFPDVIGPTLVTRDAQAIRDFHAQHQDIILKPLDGMGGMGIFRVGNDGLNIGSVIGLLPIIGVPLPLVSSGGSALVAALCAVGVLVAFARDQVPGARRVEDEPRSVGVHVRDEQIGRLL